MQCLGERSLDYRAPRILQTRALGFIEIADIEDLESVSAIRKESVGLSPGGRLLHIYSLIRAAGRDERCGVSEGTCILFTPRTKHMHVRGCQWQRDPAQEGRHNGSAAPSGVAAPPPNRQGQAELQTPRLAHMEEYARLHGRICWQARGAAHLRSRAVRALCFFFLGEA